MKTRPILFNGEMVRAILEGRKTVTRRVIHADITERIKGDPQDVLKYCPFGKVGDGFYVRETFRCVGWHTRDAVIAYRASGDEDWLNEYARRCHIVGEKRIAPTRHWRPSIHMPRWASRITLEITDVRVEKLWDIDDKAAKAEGMTSHWPRYAFTELWNSIYKDAPTPKHWVSNPYVWVVTFKQVDGGKE